MSRYITVKLIFQGDLRSLEYIHNFYGVTKLNFENMTRDELAHYIVANRNTSDGIEARRVYICRMAKKAEMHGIDLRRSQLQP